jgi:hypothetical protein
MGVEELSAFTEIHIFGNLTVETRYTPEFGEEVERVLTGNPSEILLRKWFATLIGKPTKIEVRLSMDPDYAASQRDHLNKLFDRYRRSSETVDSSK